MPNAHRQQEVVYQLTQWAEHQDSVRAMLLTSTRASPHAQVDVFSDYDVILVVRDIRPFFENRTWLQAFGQVLVSYWDPICGGGKTTPHNLVMYIPDYRTGVVILTNVVFPLSQ